MKIRMQTLSASPAGVRQAGQIVDVPEAEAKELIAGHYAVEVQPVREAAAAAPTPAATEETASVAAPETAARRVGRTAPRRNASA
jgi:hypothetical protein